MPRMNIGATERHDGVTSSLMPPANQIAGERRHGAYYCQARRESQADEFIGRYLLLALHARATFWALNFNTVGTVMIISLRMSAGAVINRMPELLHEHRKAIIVREGDIVFRHEMISLNSKPQMIIRHGAASHAWRASSFTKSYALFST